MNKTDRTISHILILVLVVFGGIAVYRASKYYSDLPLTNAARRGDVHTVQIYLETNPNPKSKTFEVMYRSSLYGAHTPYNNYVKIVGLFIDHGADANETLQRAVDENKSEIAQEAILKGANVNMPYPDGRTLLSSAKRDNDVAMIKLLKHAGARK